MAPSVAFLVVQPCVVIAGIGLLIWFLGYSALVGVAVSCGVRRLQRSLKCLQILVGSTPLVGRCRSMQAAQLIAVPKTVLMSVQARCSASSADSERSRTMRLIDEYG